MLITDRIYDQHEISEPVLVELINSSALERLKRINQAGASQYIYNWKTVSRYEHSLGVMLLLRIHHAHIHEQIAGLLHDVPHLAFSHVVDFVYENERHEYHELFHEEVINNSEIPQILNKYKIPMTVIHPENFKLLERNIPDLCADRLDYALRDFMVWKNDRESIQAKLAGIIVHRGEFMFKYLNTAESFATDYLKQDKQVWADAKETATYLILAQAIKHALDQKILKHEDLFGDDELVMSKLISSGDVFIHKKIEYLTPKFRIEPATRNHYHFYVKTKTRAVDPKVLINGQVKRLSELSPKYKKSFEKHMKEGEKGVYVEVYKE